jgi:hypothetical protein
MVRRFRQMFVLLPLVGTAAMNACTIAPTRIESSWTDATYAGPPFERVAVLALFDTVSESRNFESRAAELLSERGVEVVEGHSFLEPGVRYDREEMEQQLMTADVGGILIYRLIAVDDRQVYRPPTPYLRETPRSVMWGDPFYWYYYPNWNYYWHWRSSLDVTRSPGYWAEYTYVIVESSLYDNGSDRLIWTAKSETMDDAEFAALADSIADTITDELVELELLGTDEE